MYRDFWRVIAAAVIGFIGAAGLAFQNLHAGHPLAAAGWTLAWLGCVAILVLPAVLRGQAERRNPPHGRHSTGETKY